MLLSKLLIYINIFVAYEAPKITGSDNLIICKTILFNIIELY